MNSSLYKYTTDINSQLVFCLFAESVKALLGRHTKILVKYVVKLETKGDKTENRVLVSNLFISIHIRLANSTGVVNFQCKRCCSYLVLLLSVIGVLFGETFDYKLERHNRNNEPGGNLTI